jgi:hypothetical protein
VQQETRKLRLQLPEALSAKVTAAASSSGS